MRAWEFINEAKGKIHKDSENAMQGTHSVRDSKHLDRAYHFNRLAMALSMADGKSTNAVDMDEASWSENYNTVHPYSDVEERMLTQAIKTIPTEYKMNVGDRKSKEPESTNKVSPVNGFKGFGK